MEMTEQPWMRIIQGSNMGIEATSRSAVLPFFWLGIHDGTSAIYQIKMDLGKAYVQ